MHLINDEMEWAQMVQQYAGTQPKLYPKNWSIPSQFPCMVQVNVDPGGGPETVVFDVADALKLVQAAGFAAVSTSHNATVVNTVGPDQKEFDVAVSSHIRTLIHVMTSRGLCDAAEYEQAYAVQSSKQQQQHREDMDSLLMGLRIPPEGQ